jgi:glutaredoxin-like protein NrdH
MITVYTLPNCVQCDMTKRVMDGLGLEYDTIDLSADVEAATMVVGLGYKQAPVVVSGDRHWSGFKLDRIKSLVSIGK